MIIAIATVRFKLKRLGILILSVAGALLKTHFRYPQGILDLPGWACFVEVLRR